MAPIVNYTCKSFIKLTPDVCDDFLDHLGHVTVVLQISHTCGKFQPNASCSCFKHYFPFLLGGENIQNYFIKSFASSHYFIESITSSSCVEDTRGDTPGDLTVNH